MREEISASSRRSPAARQLQRQQPRRHVPALKLLGAILYLRACARAELSCASTTSTHSSPWGNFCGEVRMT